MPALRELRPKPSDHMPVGMNDSRQNRASSPPQPAASATVQAPARPRQAARNTTVPRNSFPQSDPSDSSEYRFETDDEVEDESGDEYHDVSMSDEELVQSDRPESQSDEAETRLARQSAPSNRLTATSRSAKASRPAGRVRDDTQGGIEYWWPEGRKWIPAIYHYEIREKLILEAAAGDDDVYNHPRAHGRKDLDVTSFLESQKDWDLERDNGWIGIEILFMFKPINNPKPTYKIVPMYDEERIVLDLSNHPVRIFRDIPSVLSSKFEGSLMALIRRLDPRIQWEDFWARMPKDSGKTKDLGHTALSERSRRWRNVNCVISWTRRWGTEGTTAFFWNRMSPAARSANSTRELKKLERRELRSLKKRNEGKHHGRRHGPANRLSKKVKPLLSYVRESAPTPIAMYNHVGPSPSGAYPWQDCSFGTTLPYAPNWPSGAMGSYIPVDPLLQPNTANNENGAYSSSDSPYEVMLTDTTFTSPTDQNFPPFEAWEVFPPDPILDYRILRPQTQEEINDIQTALSLTRDDFAQHTARLCPRTNVNQSYLYQIQEIENSLFHYWMYVLGNPGRLPDLTFYREPWRSGFKDWLDESQNFGPQTQQGGGGAYGGGSRETNPQ